MKKHFISLAILLVGGCATPEQDAQRASAICQESGGTPGTEAFEQCVGRQVAVIQDNRATTGQAIALGLQAYGNSQQQYTNSRPTYLDSRSRRISCTSTQSYGTTYTNCY